MPKVKVASLTATKLQSSQGSFLIVGRDGAGREVEIELPIGAMRRLSAEMQRAAMATPRPSSVPANATPGEWGEVVPLDVRNAAVGIIQPPAGPAVGVVFDQGFDTELTFRLPVRTAMELGKLILGEAEKLGATTAPSTPR